MHMATSLLIYERTDIAQEGKISTEERKISIYVGISRRCACVSAEPEELLVQRRADNKLLSVAGWIHSDQEFAVRCGSNSSPGTETGVDEVGSPTQSTWARRYSSASARRGLTMMRRQRELGATSQSELILAWWSYREAAIRLVEAQASRYMTTVALLQALGGGWWRARDGADAVQGSSK